MTPDVIDRLEQVGRTVVVYSPLLLLLFKSFRAWVKGALTRMAEPITSRLRANDAALSAMSVTLQSMEATMQSDLGAIRAQVSVIAGIARLQQDTAHDVGYFECDAAGRNSWVSATYIRWMRATADELLGWGFVNFTNPDDRNRVLTEWARCREQHTDYRERILMGPIGGPYVEYEVLVRPIPDAPPAVAWAGSIRPAMSQGIRRIESLNVPRSNTGD